MVTAALCACTFDFDAPFEQSGDGGGTSAGPGPGPSSSADSQTSTGAGDGGAGVGTGGGTGATSTSTSSATTSGSGAGGDISIPCGAAACTFAPGDGGCCWDENEAHGGDQADCFTSAPSGSDCRTNASTNSREALLQCRDASDCSAGDVCCAAYVLDGLDRVYSAATCASACGGSMVALCDPAAGDPCPLSEASCESAAGLPDDYFACIFG